MQPKDQKTLTKLQKYRTNSFDSLFFKFEWQSSKSEQELLIKFKVNFPLEDRNTAAKLNDQPKNEVKRLHESFQLQIRGQIKDLMNMPVENRRVFFSKLQKLRMKKYEGSQTDFVEQNAS